MRLTAVLVCDIVLTIAAITLAIIAITQSGAPALCRGTAYNPQTQVTETWYYECHQLK
jgi:hypothetical protein